MVQSGQLRLELLMKQWHNYLLSTNYLPGSHNLKGRCFTGEEMKASKGGKDCLKSYS